MALYALSASACRTWRTSGDGSRRAIVCPARARGWGLLIRDAADWPSRRSDVLNAKKPSGSGILTIDELKESYRRSDDAKERYAVYCQKHEAPMGEMAFLCLRIEAKEQLLTRLEADDTALHEHSEKQGVARAANTPSELRPPKAYPRVAGILRDYMNTNGCQSKPPSAARVARIMHAAGTDVEQAVVEAILHQCRRGLLPGTKNGPKSYKWFESALHEYFQKAIELPDSKPAPQAANGVEA